MFDLWDFYRANTLFFRVLLGFVPERILLGEGEVPDLNAAFFTGGFHVIEPLIELLVGLA